MMKTTENRFRGITRFLGMVLLLSMALWVAGCMSGRQLQKSEKHGQVPCPCEKNNKR